MSREEFEAALEMLRFKPNKPDNGNAVRALYAAAIERAEDEHRFAVESMNAEKRAIERAEQAERAVGGEAVNTESWNPRVPWTVGEYNLSEDAWAIMNCENELVTLAEWQHANLIAGAVSGLLANTRLSREAIEMALENYTECVEALDAFDPEPLIVRKQARVEEARAALLALIFPEPS